MLGSKKRANIWQKDNSNYKLSEGGMDWTIISHYDGSYTLTSAALPSCTRHKSLEDAKAKKNREWLKAINSLIRNEDEDNEDED
jgi:hypothetical protein